VASARGRSSPTDVAGRNVIAVAALAYAAVIAAATWVWSGAPASDGRADRLREGASVDVTMRGVRVGLAHTLTIGHAADASVHVPGAGADVLARIEVDEAGEATARATAPASIVIAVTGAADPATLAAQRGCRPDRHVYTLPRGASIVVIECEDTTPLRAFVVRRDRKQAELSISPLSWRAGRFVAERRTLRAGDALRLGGAGEAIPGLVTWDVVAPRDAVAMLAIPIDPTECTQWSPVAGAARPAPAGCEVLAGAFELAAHPLVPDAAAVLERAARSALVIAAPALLLMLVVLLSPRRARRAGVVGRGLRLAVVSGGLVALICWRLAWAYRIDMLRDLSLGSRTLENELAAIAIGAALAGNAVLALDVLEGASPIRRGLAATAGWAVWLMIGWLVIGVEAELTTTRVGILGLSLVAATIPLIGEIWRSITRSFDGPHTGRRPGRLGTRSASEASPPSSSSISTAPPPSSGTIPGYARADEPIDKGRAGDASDKPESATSNDLDSDNAVAYVEELDKAAEPDVPVGRQSSDEPDKPDNVERATCEATSDVSSARSDIGERRRELDNADTADKPAEPDKAAETDESDDSDAACHSRDDRFASSRSRIRERLSLSRLGVELVLAAIAGVALIANASASRGALVKLGLAYATVLAGHAALRTALGHDTSWVRRVGLGAALGGAVLCVGMHDAGVTLAIVGVGLAIAMLVAGHDAMYEATHASQIGLLEREHARLLAVHGVATIGLAIAVAWAGLAASERELIEYGAIAILQVPLVAAGLFGLAALVARTHRRSWAPWLAAALAALAIWGMRDAILARVTSGDGVASDRVAAVVEPGYALLRDDRAFAANASAWREATLSAPTDDHWSGQGYFGARIRDPGVVRSIENDYLPVLVARETGIGGLVQTVALLLAIIVAAALLAGARLRHASREHRSRSLICAVVGSLVVYQPLAAVGILPLTGISWPGLGIDSPADLWLFVIGLVWCVMGGETGPDDERVRGTRRLVRARRIVLAALVLAGVVAIAIVARAGACALGRATIDDDRVTAALRYATTISCAPVVPASEAATPLDVGAPEEPPAKRTSSISPPLSSPRLILAGQPAESPALAAGHQPTTLPVRDDSAPRLVLDERIPEALGGTPTDDATRRYDRELRAAWILERAMLSRALDKPAAALTIEPTMLDVLERFGLRRDRISEALAEIPRPAIRCPERAGNWRLVRDGDRCIATLDTGWPRITLAVSPGTASCSVELPESAVSTLRPPTRAPQQRIRLVSAPLGVAADAAGELVIGKRIIRLHAGGPTLELASLGEGLHRAGKLTIGDVVLETQPTPRRVIVRGPAELFVAEREPALAWRRLVHANEIALDRVTIIAAGIPEKRVAILFRPPRAWGADTVVDALVADTADGRRFYPYGNALPEVGWVNPYALERSLGLDGWVHAALARPTTPAACGSLEPPAITRDRVCSTNPVDGVTECRIALQPQLALALRALVDKIIANPEPYTGRPTHPVRIAYVAMRGDTGEILAQASIVPGRPGLAYAPSDAEGDARLVRLRNEPGEADAERVDWNLPIAVGSLIKPVVARAAEQAFPTHAAALALGATGHATGCRPRRGKPVAPIMGHCPPTSLAGNPATADLHDFLQRSPNWYQAALGLVGLGLPDGQLAAGDEPMTFEELVASDLSGWPTDIPLTISDARGSILGRRGVSIDGMRRTPLWTRIETLLGRPICTLGDRAACERAAARADVCAARGLPIANAGRDLRNLVSLGPDRIDPYPDDRTGQRSIPVREYLQLLRGSGVHPIGSLAQITDAFGRVIYDPTSKRVAASWFPAPVAGTIPNWSCAKGGAHAVSVLGADGGLCAVVRPDGTAHGAMTDLLADPKLVIYGAKTGTTDSLADIARSQRACRAWNARHAPTAQLECGRTPLDDSLYVIAFGVVTPRGTIPITLGLQLQRSGKSGASRASNAFVRAISDYLTK
jgi:hypothetical protein